MLITQQLKHALQWYSKRLETHPLTTKGLTSGLVSGSGDLLCQAIVGHYRNHHRTNDVDNNGNNKQPQSFLQRVDWIRTARFAFLGTVLVAPIVHYWYGALMKYIPGQTIMATFQRTFYDQTVMAPLFIPTFMSCLMMLEGKTSFEKEIVPALQREYKDLLITNWFMWIPAQLVNFRFVPSRFQVLFSNVVALLWNAYFSYKTSSSSGSLSQFKNASTEFVPDTIK